MITYNCEICENLAKMDHDLWGQVANGEPVLVDKMLICMPCLTKMAVSVITAKEGLGLITEDIL